MPASIRSLTIAAMFLFAGSLFAQHYAERDHTMFHRPAAPASTQKHQPSGSHSTSMTRRSGSAAATPAQHSRAATMPGSPSASDSRGVGSLQIPTSR